MGVFICCAVVCFYSAEHILDWIIKPAGTLVFTAPGGGFNAVMTITLVMAFLISFPFTIYQIWAFVKNALKPQEKHFVFIFGPLSLLFFVAGVAFAYGVAIPMSYKFLLGFASPSMMPMITVDNYLGFVGNFVIIFGVTFELPLIIAFFAMIGIATPEFLRQKRRYAVMGILILAAVLTPPDIMSQLLLAVPLLVLYEVGIIFARIFQKKR